MTPRVSVIMAAHNAERTIGAAVRSILWQTLSSLELIVVDDCSTDGTHEVLCGLAKEDPRLRIVRNAQRRERSWSRNRAVHAARAELIAVLDADDVALPQRLEMQTQLLERNPGLALLGGGGFELDGRTGLLASLSTAALDSAAVLARMRYHNPFVHSSVVFRREAAVQAGLYDTTMSAAEDSDLFWRMLRGRAARIVPDPVVLVRVDWVNQRQVSRLRRQADVRTRWRGMRRQAGGAVGDWLFLLPGVVRLAVPSAIDTQLREWKRRLQRPPSAPGVHAWIHACETGERPFPAPLTTLDVSAAAPDGERPGPVVR